MNTEEYNAAVRELAGQYENQLTDFNSNDPVKVGGLLALVARSLVIQASKGGNLDRNLVEGEVLLIEKFDQLVGLERQELLNRRQPAH